jgi:hypothetical protein
VRIPRPTPTRRRFGYLVWGVAFLVTIVPELLASINAVEKHLPFPTISRTVGHLEVINPAWEILPTFLIVLFVYALLRAPLPQLVGSTPAPELPEARAVSGDGGDDQVPADYRRFLFRAALCLVFLIAVWRIAPHIWPNQHLATMAPDKKLPNFYVAYCFWGATFVVWVVLPTITAALGNQHKFPSLPKTIVNFEQWLGRTRSGIWDRIGRGAAWAFGFILVWGMAFLLLHLTLYPFPDITRQLNKSEVVCTVDGKPAIVSRLPKDKDPSCHFGDYPPGNGG